MARSKDWIPAKNLLFKEFQDTFCAGADDNQAGWVLDPGKVTILLKLQKTYLGFYAITAVKNGFTGLDEANTASAKKALKKAVRTMGIDEMKTNANMTDEDRMSVGVHNDSGTHTAAPIEKTSPVIQGSNKGSLGYQIIHSSAGSIKSHELPAGQIGIITKIGFYKKGDTVPTEDLCTQMDILGKSPAMITFNGTNFGLLFIGFARYINSRKQLGLVATTFTGVVS